MPISPTEAVRRSRRLAVVATSLALTVSSAFAAPRMVSPQPVSDAASGPGTPVAGSDVLLRFLAEREPAAAPVSNVPSPLAEPAFVERVRDRASDMVVTAMNFLGVPYRRGGSNADHGFDCSGFTRHIFEMSIGLVLPRRADEQATTAGLLRIGRDDLRPGDLVFFNTMRRTFSHVGIYLGEGRFIHSPKPGGEVRVDDMRAAYWDQRFTGGRRAETSAATPAVAAPHPLLPRGHSLN